MLRTQGECDERHVPLQIRQEYNALAIGLHGQGPPGRVPPRRSPYDLHEQPACDAYIYDLEMTIDIPGSRIEVEISMVVCVGERVCVNG